jgi:hypothetical protein
MFALDISKGFAQVTAATIKQYTPAELKAIMVNIGIVQRDIRGEQIPLEDIMALKDRNMRLQRLNQAQLIISNYAKQRRIVL